MFHSHKKKSKPVFPLKFTSVLRSSRRPLLTRLVACLAMGALFSACLGNGYESGEGTSGAALINDSVSFTGLDGQDYVATKGDLSIANRSVTWTTEVEGQAYVVHGRMQSTEPLTGRIGVSNSDGEELLAFLLHDGMWSVSADENATVRTGWPLAANPQDSIGLTEEARLLLLESTVGADIAAPLLLEAFPAVLQPSAMTPSTNDGVGSTTQTSLIGLIVALTALIVAITGLIHAVDQADGGICSGSSASCGGNGASVTCSGCQRATCTYGVAECSCACL